jgi:hypothetical protein
MTQQKNQKQRSPLGKRMLATQMTAARLWLPDTALLKETAKKRRITEAELLRDIVHRWCVVERRAPGTQEELNDQVLINLQKETLTKVESGLKSIADRMGFLADASSGFGELLNLNEVLLTRLMNTSNGQYNMSAQTFAALWSLLELVQRYFVERVIASGRLPCMDKEVHEACVLATDNIRAEGLRMVQRLLKDCGSPQPVEPRLISPARYK